MADEVPSLAESKLTALVVDDNFVNQTMHHKLLDRLGIKNDVVCNGQEAVDVHCSGRNYDLILMDMEMPILNGIQVILIYYIFSSLNSLRLFNSYFLL